MPQPSEVPLKQLKAPASDPRNLTKAEQIILLRGSKLHGSKFLQWEKEPQPSEFEGPAFEDPTDFHLSEEQLRIFDSWQRAPHAAASAEPQPQPLDLVQDLATDCSVVASLCAETARAWRLTQASLLAGTLRPAAGASASGRYVARLNFNGAFRRVDIDDRLPESRTGRALHVKDRGGSGATWPALLEKAYLKVTGGYDFPGSNSGTDLWVLTGWIPEQLVLKADDLVPSALWRRLHAAFGYGDVLVTIGTGALSPAEEERYGLAREHAYAVTGMREHGGRRLVRVKNPWSEGGTWRGAQEAEPEAAGTFWMELGSVLQHFDTIYLNWNPGLFRCRRDAHFAWDLAGARGRAGCFAQNPQYLLRTGGAGPVWLLLSRHYADFSRADVKPGAPDPRLQRGYLSLYAFDAAHRVDLSQGSLVRAPYVDAPNVLLRFEAPAAGTEYVIVPSEQEMPERSHTFTLSAFSSAPLAAFGPAPARFPHAVSRRGAWTRASAGGSAANPTFPTNPQFALTLPAASPASLLLEAADPQAPVQVKLVWAGGRRARLPLARRDVLGDSGEYRRGCALAELAAVPAGTYTAVVSAFEPGRLGDFALTARTECAGATLREIPAAERPGMFAVPLAPALLPPGVDRVLVPVRASRLARFAATARVRGKGAASPLRLAVEFGQGPLRFELAASGGFEAAGEVATPEVDVKPAMCAQGAPGVWLVVERMGGGQDRAEEVYVEAFSDESGVTFGEWGAAVDEPIEAFEQRLRIEGGR